MMNVSQFVLENRIDAETYAELAAAVTSHWDQDFAKDPANKKFVEDVVFRRHDNSVKYLLPWLESVSPLGGSKWIDYGSGCGSSALALSHVAEKIDSFEIHQASVDAFEKRMAVFGVSSAKVHTGSPETLIDAAIDLIDGNTSVLMLAVVEHLLEREQIDYLGKIWNALAPGQCFAMVETPNFAAWFDTHTFQKPLIHMASDEALMPYLKRQPSSLRFRDGIVDTFETKGASDASVMRRRLGLGVTHHVFEAAFQTDLNEIVVADAFHPAMLAWFKMIYDDSLLLSAFDHYKIDVPIGFARSVLSFVFQKPLSTEVANQNKIWNQQRREEMIEKYALSRKKANTEIVVLDKRRQSIA